MKRVLAVVPGIKLGTDFEKLAPVLLSMGPERVTVEAHDPNDYTVEAERMKVATGVVFEAPDELSPKWVERMVNHALKDAGLDLKVERVMTIG